MLAVEPLAAERNKGDETGRGDEGEGDARADIETFGEVVLSTRLGLQYVQAPSVPLQKTASRPIEGSPSTWSDWRKAVETKASAPEPKVHWENLNRHRRTGAQRSASTVLPPCAQNPPPQTFGVEIGFLGGPRTNQSSHMTLKPWAKYSRLKDGIVLLIFPNQAASSAACASLPVGKTPDLFAFEAISAPELSNVAEEATAHAPLLLKLPRKSALRPLLRHSFPNGITERIPLQLPRRVRRRLDELDFIPWLHRIAKLAGPSSPHPHSSPSDASSDDDMDEPPSGDHYADALANQFYQIELAEQRRLMNIMQHHSQESGVVVVEDGKATRNTGFPYSITAGVEKGAKNRYRHIWPFEHARVKLQARDDDYVNASYVQPLFTNKRYIATQGPLPATFTDFWTLCWEQNVHVIVMLTREVEGAMVKCGSYWSDHEYGPLRLRLVSTSQTHDKVEPEEPTGFFSAHAAVPSRPPVASSSTPRKAQHYHQGATVRRVFELSHTGYENAKPRKIVHLQYLDWPDMNVPDDARGVLGLIKQVDEAVAEVKGEETPMAPGNSGISAQALNKDRPILLHCSAGVGRTGGFIVVDSILDAIRREVREKKVKSTATTDAMDIVPGQTLSSGHTIHVPVAEHPFSAPMDVDVDESDAPPLTEVSETSIDFPRDDFARNDTQKWAENVGVETSYGKDLTDGSGAVNGAAISSLDSASPDSRSSSSEGSSIGHHTPSSTQEFHPSSSLATSISSGPQLKLDGVPFFGKTANDHQRERTTSAPVPAGVAKPGIKRVPPSLNLGLGQLQRSAASSTPSFPTTTIQRHPSGATSLAVNPPLSSSSNTFTFSSVSQSPVPPLMTSSKLSSYDSAKAPRPLHVEGSPLPLSASKDPIWDIVQDMREQRMSLCQSLRQYVFVHKAIIEGALMILDEETGSGSNGDVFASSIDVSRVRDRVIPPRTAPSRFSQPTRSSHSRSSSVSSRCFPSTSPSQRRRKGSSSRCQSPSPTESTSSSRHPIPPLMFQQALSMESVSSAASSHGKRSASPTELRKEGTQGESYLSKRPSVKRKRELSHSGGHRGSDTDESLAGSDIVGVIQATPSAKPTSIVTQIPTGMAPVQRMAH
ncbi:hypothetical protein NMY22_g16824 [Coprinellus aureogranulatus]|nr:hypothetical protein NMY22_g16824 [Coprinellus aureogranulatus]